MSESPERPLTPSEYETFAALPWGERWACGFCGFMLIYLGVALFLHPPTRKSHETSETTESERAELPATKKSLIAKTSESPAEPNALVLLLAGTGAAFIVFAINGRRITKFEAAGVSTETSEIPHHLGQNEDSVPKNQSTLGAPAIGPLPNSQPVNDQRWTKTEHPAVQYGSDVVHTFLLRSSWNGLRILKAIQWAAKVYKPLRLRDVCKVGSEISFDYGYGYFIASFSAGLFVGFADPVRGEAVVSEIHPTLDAKIDEVIGGAISGAPPQISEMRRNDLNALLAYLGDQ